MRGRSDKSGLAIGTLLLFPVLLTSCMAHVEPLLAPEVLQERVLGPGRSLSLCEFDLLNAAGSGTAAILGLAGAIYDAAKAQKDTPYATELTADFSRIYEETLMGAGSFPYLLRAKLAPSPDGKPMPMDAAARGNGLHTCLKATSSLLVAVGWHKKVKIATTWEMTGRSGWKMTIETEAISQESQGMFPDTADPKLKPVFLGLAHESVQMFLAQLAERGILPAATTAAPLNATPCGASNESYLRSEVAPLAQTDFHCPIDQIATRYLDTKCYRAEATGCGYTRQYSYGDSGWVGAADVSRVGGAQTLPYPGPASPGPRPVP